MGNLFYICLMENLTKEEAIELMKKGVKVTHRYFTKDEWITMKGCCTIITEDRCKLSADEFWKYRQSESFNDGWSVYK